MPAAEIVVQGTTCEVVETSGALLRTPVGDFDFQMADLLYLEAGLRAAESGFDAVFVNSVLDYGVRLLRSVSSIPVVGAGQASIDLVAYIAKTFSIVTVWPVETHSSYERLIHDNAAVDRCVSIRHVNDKREDLGEFGGAEAMKQKIRDHSSDILDRIIRECQAAVESDGAEAIILGCTCMSPAFQAIQAAVRRPVADPLSAGYKAAETAAILGLGHRRPETEALAVSPRAQVTAMLGALPGLGDVDFGGCAVCPVGA